MIRFSPKDSERPVYLLDKQQPRHRVGKGHGGKGEAQVAPGTDFGRETEIATDHKDQLPAGEFPFTE